MMRCPNPDNDPKCTGEVGRYSRTGLCRSCAQRARRRTRRKNRAAADPPAEKSRPSDGLSKTQRTVRGLRRLRWEILGAEIDALQGAARRLDLVAEVRLYPSGGAP